MAGTGREPGHSPGPGPETRGEWPDCEGKGKEEEEDRQDQRAWPSEELGEEEEG